MGHIGGCQIHTEENIEKNPLKHLEKLSAKKSNTCMKAQVVQIEGR